MHLCCLGTDDLKLTFSDACVFVNEKKDLIIVTKCTLWIICFKRLQRSDYWI